MGKLGGARDMAKWGEGDARWIVEERSDGANVNDWHWTEKCVTGIAERRLREVIEREELAAEGCSFSKVDSFSGFVNLTNRKGKVNVQYSLDVALKWKRVVRGNDGDVTGEASGCVKMEEIFDDEPETVLTVDKKSKGSAAEPDRNVKEVLCKEAVRLINDLIRDLQQGKVDCSKSP